MIVDHLQLEVPRLGIGHENRRNMQNANPKPLDQRFHKAARAREMLERDFPGYDPLAEAIKIAMDPSTDKGLALKAHLAIAEFKYPKMRSVEQRTTEDRNITLVWDADAQDPVIPTSPKIIEGEKVKRRLI